MSADPVRPVPDSPDPPPQPEGARLKKALALIEEEAMGTLAAGGSPRAYARTEKLLAIARAVRAEMNMRVEDFLEDDCGSKKAKFVVGGGDIGGNIEWDGDIDTTITTMGSRKRGASADMRREQELAQIEALEARRRRDEAAARASTIEEFESLQRISAAGLPAETQAGIEERLTEIAEQLRRTAPAEGDDDEHNVS